MKLVDLPRDLWKKKLTFGFFDDFNEYVSGDLWTLVKSADGSGTLLGTVAGGVVDIKSNTTGTADAATLLHSTSASFYFTADKPLRFGAYAAIPEAATNLNNALLGLSQVITEELMADADAGPIATENYGAYFFSPGSTTSVYVGHQNNTTQTEVELTASNSLDGIAHTTGSTYRWFELVCLPTGGTNMDVLYYIDGVHVYKSSVTFTASKKMYAVLNTKQGDTTAEHLYVDACYCYQTR